MINKLDISSERNLHGWLLMPTLVFVFFSFSGFIGNAPDQQQVFRTELVVNTNLAVKKATHFNGAFKKPPIINISAIFPKLEIKYVLIAYNLLNKTQFDFIATHTFTFAQPQKFFRIRSISQSSEEDLSHLFRG